MRDEMGNGTGTVVKCYLLQEKLFPLKIKLTDPVADLDPGF